MVNYNNGKIYKIVNDVNNKFYIGSTAEKYLSNRMALHRNKHSKCMSKNLDIDLKECSIILIENYPCKDKNELLRKEREYFDKYKKECKEVFVNKNRPMRYKGEKKQLTKETTLLWKKNNREKSRETQNKYYSNHKEKINKDVNIKKYKKEYYEKNIEKIKEKGKEKITCECGRTIIKASLSRHKKSKNHLAYLALIN